MTPSTPTLAVGANALLYKAATSAGPWSSSGATVDGKAAVVCFANDKYVSIDASGTIRTSSDGITWTLRNTQPSDFIIALATLVGNQNNVLDPNSAAPGVSGWRAQLYTAGGYFVFHNECGNVVSADGITWHATGAIQTDTLTKRVGPIQYDPLTNTWFALYGDGRFFVSAAGDPTTGWSLGSVYISGGPTSESPLGMAGDGQGGFYAVFSHYVYYTDLSLGSTGAWNKRWVLMGTIPETPGRVQFINGTFVFFTKVYGKIYTGTAGSGAMPTLHTISTAYTGGSHYDIQLADKYMIFGEHLDGSGNSVPDILVSSSIASGYTAGSISAIPTSGGVLLGAGYGFPYTVPTSVGPSGAVATDTPTLVATPTRFPGDELLTVQFQVDTANTFNTANLRTVSTTRFMYASPQGPVSVRLPDSLAIPSNGTWYVRARVVGASGSVGSWSAASTMTVTLPSMPVPTALTITALNDYIPTVGATATALAGFTYNVEWLVATDSGFTNVIDHFVTGVPVASGIVSGARQGSLYTAYAAGTYYIKARQVSTTGRASAYTSNSTFTMAPYTITAVPTAVAMPTSVVGSNLPSYSVTYPLDSRMVNYQRQFAVQVQIAADSGFTTNVSTAYIGAPPIYLPANGDSTGGRGGTGGGRTLTALTFSAAGSIQLTQGNWYVRFREVDDQGMIGSWSTGTSFTVSHPPSASLVSPPNAQTSIYGSSNSFSWTFQDSNPGDVGTKSEIIIRRASDNAVLYDVVTNGSSNTVAIAIDAGYKLVPLTWQVRLWDSEGVAGPWSPLWTVTFADQAVVSITAPSTTVVSSGRPTISWTLSGGAAQKTFAVKVTRQSDGFVVWSTTGTTAQSVTPNLNILTNGTDYVIQVDVSNVVNLTSTSSVAITATFTPPPSPYYVVDYTGFYENGYVNLDWTGTVPDASFYSWTVYRQDLGIDQDWVLIYTTTDQTNKVYRDWSAVSGHTYRYVVTQAADRFGALLESSISSLTPAQQVTAGYWWLINPNDETDNVKVAVTGDQFTEEYEEATYTVIGRGRRREIGTLVGVTGQLTASLKPSYDGTVTANDRLNSLRTLRAQATAVQLRNPFGGSLTIAVGELQWQHEPGYGATEVITATIQVDEVY